MKKKRRIWIFAVVLVMAASAGRRKANFRWGKERNYYPREQDETGSDACKKDS